MPSSAAATPSVTALGKQVFVDVCTDQTMMGQTVGYRQTQGCTILQIYSAPEAEAVYVTSFAPNPTGPTLSLPMQKTWVIISQAG
jgi:hypothetical protein